MYKLMTSSNYKMTTIDEAAKIGLWYMINCNVCFCANYADEYSAIDAPSIRHRIDADEHTMI